jgi:hypothetical protein
VDHSRNKVLQFPNAIQTLLCLCFVVAGNTALVPIQNIQDPMSNLDWSLVLALSLYGARDKRYTELATTKREIWSEN